MMRIPWHSERETWRGCLSSVGVAGVAGVEGRSRWPSVSLLLEFLAFISLTAVYSTLCLLEGMEYD